MIEHMLKASSRAAALRALLPDCLVEELDDGRMGSVRFDSQLVVGRRLGADLCQMEFLDSDGVPVIATLTLDNFGQLFELDMWKADFSAIQRFPLTH